MSDTNLFKYTHSFFYVFICVFDRIYNSCPLLWFLTTPLYTIIIPNDCFKQNRLWRYHSQELKNQPICIPKDLMLAKDMLWTGHIKSLHREFDMLMAMIAPFYRIAGANRTMKR